MYVKEYNRLVAIDYSYRWAFGRNPAYYNFDDIGGDCTNFISQCVYAGSGVMNYTPTYGWYYNSVSDRSPSWTGVQYFYNFMVKNRGVGPFAQEVNIEQVEPGDIVQLSFDGSHFTHSMLVQQVGADPEPENILVATHSFDSSNRPLSTYTYLYARYIHILGVRVDE